MMKKPVLVGAILACLSATGIASSQVVFTKVQVADRIRKVEDGVDEFRKWAENRAEQGQSKAQAAKASARTRGRTATESQKAVANDKKDELDNALGDLNRSTNRLRRSFDPTDKWMETRPQVESVLDDGRKINQGLWYAASTAHRPSAIGVCCVQGDQRSGTMLQPDTTLETTTHVNEVVAAADNCRHWRSRDNMSTDDKVQRSSLPIPDIQHAG